MLDKNCCVAKLLFLFSLTPLMLDIGIHGGPSQTADQQQAPIEPDAKPNNGMMKASVKLEKTSILHVWMRAVRKDQVGTGLAKRVELVAIWLGNVH